MCINPTWWHITQNTLRRGTETEGCGRADHLRPPSTVAKTSTGAAGDRRAVTTTTPPLSKGITHDTYTYNETYPWQPSSWANMGPSWGRQDPAGPHVGPMNFAISDRLRRRNASNAYFARERTVLSLFVFNNSIHLNIEGLTLKYVGRYCHLISWYLGLSSGKSNSSLSLWHMIQCLDSYSFTGLSTYRFPPAVDGYW